MLAERAKNVKPLPKIHKFGENGKMLYICSWSAATCISLGIVSQENFYFVNSAEQVSSTRNPISGIHPPASLMRTWVFDAKAEQTN